MADSDTTGGWLHSVLPEEMSAAPGWYPVLTCWEPHEGFFPNAGQWTGSAWISTGPVSAYWPLQFEDQKKAEEFAYEHDPNW